MKAITDYQPWAQLLAVGAKKYETRSWQTNYRGPIAIHAGKKKAGEVIRSLHNQFSTQRKMAIALGMYEYSYSQDFDALPHGAIIATAELVGCHFMYHRSGEYGTDIGSGVLRINEKIIKPTAEELLFGDWTPGRYAWELANVRMLPEPIPAKGKQGLWEWTQPDGWSGGEDAK